MVQITILIFLLPLEVSILADRCPTIATVDARGNSGCYNTLTLVRYLVAIAVVVQAIIDIAVAISVATKAI